MLRNHFMTRHFLIWHLAAVMFVLHIAIATAAADSKSNLLATDILTAVVPLTGLAVVCLSDNAEGRKQWLRNICVNQILITALRVGFNETSLGERPNGNDYGFPSGHVAFVMSGATFLHQRYGWKWGIPAYLAAASVACVRVDEDKHHWRDVLASGALSYGVGMFTITSKNATYLAPVIGPDFIGLRWGRSF